MKDSDSKSSRYDVTDLAACTCGKLRKATRLVTQLYDAALLPSGLKATQFTLLSTLAYSGPIPLTRLAAELVMDRTTLTRNLKPLVAQGFVRIEPAADRRVRQVVLTASGIRVQAAARPLWEGAQSRLVGKLGVERWSGLLDDLSVAIATVREQ